jgi:hypothetical protein
MVVVWVMKQVACRVLGLVLLLRNMLVAVRDAEAGPKIVMLFVALHDA